MLTDAIKETPACEACRTINQGLEKLNCAAGGKPFNYAFTHRGLELVVPSSILLVINGNGEAGAKPGYFFLKEAALLA